jgi:hypothetical protein
MRNLKDYSGEYLPDFKLQDLSKDALVKLVEAASKDYIGIDGLWTSVIRKRYGDKLAFDCSREVWDTGWLREAERTVNALNINRKTIADLLKYLQVDPGFGAMFTVKCELINPNLGMATVLNCNTLLYAERHNDSQIQKLACEELDVPLFTKTAHFFNPDMKVKVLKLPPRKSPDEIACQWEFRLEA